MTFGDKHFVDLQAVSCVHSNNGSRYGDWTFVFDFVSFASIADVPLK